jgi:hypothetical protein
VNDWDEAKSSNDGKEKQMLLKPGLRKFALTAHITTSVGWLGAAVGFLAHAIAGLTSQDAQMVRAAYLVMELTGWYVLVPLSLASLATGLIQSLGTKWGLFRHYWVLAKFLLTLVATIILLTFMRGFSGLVSVALDSELSGVNLGSGHGAASPVVHASAGILVLLVCVTLSIYKPWGKTPWDRRGAA